ncbi:MAG: tetratricopeptide repeat protein [Bacteroidales bacterium]
MKKAFIIFLLFTGCAGWHAVAQESSDEMLAAQYFRQGQYDKAVALYKDLFEKKNAPVIYNNYLESLLALNEFKEAEKVVRRLMDDYPDQVRYDVDMGWVWHRSGNQRRSRRLFDDLIAGMQPRTQQVLDLADAFQGRGLNDYALETYLRGRRLLGSTHPLHLDIAALYEKMGRYLSMMEEYLDYLNTNLAQMDQVRGILQDAINDDPGYEKNEALREVLLVRTQSQPSNTLYSEMLLWLSLQQLDFQMAFMQARALDRRLQQQGQLVLEVARLSAANKDYPVASRAFQYLLDQGEDTAFYLEALTGLLDVQFLEITASYSYSDDDLRKVEKDYMEALDHLPLDASTVRLVRNLANLQAFYLDNTGAAIDLLQRALDTPGISSRVKGECKIELADILLLTGQVWDATLLYSQVDKSFRDDPLAHEAKFKNARLSFYIGEFQWARAQLDILKAGTSRLIANDAMELSLRIQDNIGFDEDTRPLKMFARAEMHAFRNHFQQAIQVLDSVLQTFPGHPIYDDVLYAQAEIHLKLRDYEQADSLLARIVEMFPTGLLADEALFQRAVLHHQIHENKQQAMSLYQQLIINYPGSLNTITARNRFRTLRGDVIN